MSLAKFQGVIIAILVIGILVGVGILVADNMRDSMGETACAARADGYTTYVAASNLCSNGTATSAVSNSAAWNGTTDWMTAQTNLSSKAGTAGTLFGVGLIIVAVFGGILFFMGRSGRP